MCNLGFDVVMSEVIGCIDVDIVFELGWVEEVCVVFVDDIVDGVIGLMFYYDMLLCCFGFCVDDGLCWVIL